LSSCASSAPTANNLHGPDFRRVVQDAELQRQVRTAVFQTRVHASSVGLEVLASRAESAAALCCATCGIPSIRCCLSCSRPSPPPAHHFREPPTSKPAHDIHLPQAVLRSHIPLREKQVRQAGRINGRNPVSIARDHNFLLQSRRGQVPSSCGSADRAMK